MNIKMILGLMAICPLQALAQFSPPYIGEARSIQIITDEFQDAAEAFAADGHAGCPLALQRQVSQQLFDDARFKADNISAYSNNFGTTRGGQHFSNAFINATVPVTIHGLSCTGGGEHPVCIPITYVNDCSVYRPVHFLPVLNENGVGTLDGAVLL